MKPVQAPKENFPVAVMRVRIYDVLLNALLRVTTELISDATHHLDYSSVLAGRINRGMQRQIPEPGTEWLFREERQLIFSETMKLGQKYTALCAKDEFVARHWATCALELDDMWCVSQLAEDYNPRHAHNGTLSGVFYLCVPPTIETATAEDGCLAFVHSNPLLEVRHASAARLYDFIPRDVLPSSQQPVLKRHVVRPHVGEGWIFPSWLLHEVPAFHGDGERRSVAFNMVVKRPGVLPPTQQPTLCQCERVELFPV